MNRISRRFGTALTVVLLAVALAGCGGGPKRQLRMNLPPGSSFELTTRSDNLLESEIGGEDLSMSIRTEARLLFRIASVYENGDVLANVTIRKVEPSFLWAGLGHVVEGEEFGARISPIGAVVDLVGTGELRDRLRAKVPGAPARDDVDLARTPEEHLIMAMSDDSLRAPIELALRVWPAVPVSRGDTWESEPVYEVETDTYTTRKFTLKAWEPTLVTVSFESTSVPAQRRKGISFSGTGKGELRIAPVEGLVKSLQSSSAMTGTNNVDDPNSIKMSRTGSYHADIVPR